MKGDAQVAPKTPLRAVTKDDALVAKPRPTTLTEAADSSERELLVMMRDTISTQIAGGVPPHTLAPLMRQLREVDKEIRGLDARAAHESSASSAAHVDSTFNASAI
jgi:hypothetical protein